MTQRHSRHAWRLEGRLSLHHACVAGAYPGGPQVQVSRAPAQGCSRSDGGNRTVLGLCLPKVFIGRPPGGVTEKGSELRTQVRQVV